ncbi:2-dehydro-3-deoxygalactonokinase [Tautonia plasticadhaerens]|uniref:2-keto-3-deoxy-galactonokinase n=1 Tax=Tautonia plasticadhaerens TaxID=2527974 RepID=A0A518HD22_9BACT|nr:2-dehydro-3-deoxygalactonokinase [Tautonia plasticadhaerens]QDV38759.1 2-keto-3-deoxy-galactonokinase [Tautonia plasticadhaerens]
MSDRTSRFISGDWGTSRLRLRLVDPASPGLPAGAEVESDDGIGPTFRAWQEAGSPDDREASYLGVLARALDRLRDASGADLDGLPLVLSGMASSTIGLRELPYAPAPFRLSGESLPVARIAPGVLPCETLLLSGVCTDSDVMRGEETILIGLAADGLADGLVVLPGTHSKHAVIRDGILEQFHTYMTGELFAILREHSVLRPSLAPSPSLGDAFERGVREAASGANLLRDLFSIRARSVLHGADPADNAARLSGLLIGTELLGLASGPDADLPIVVASPEPLGSFYRSALDVLGTGRRARALSPAEADRAVARGQGEVLRSHVGG